MPPQCRPDRTCVADRQLQISSHRPSPDFSGPAIIFYCDVHVRSLVDDAPTAAGDLVAGAHMDCGVQIYVCLIKLTVEKIGVASVRISGA